MYEISCITYPFFYLSKIPCMDLLIHISSQHSKRILEPLTQACARSEIQWSCFLTNDGVKVLESETLQSALKAAEMVIVCKLAWNLHMPDEECPAQFGSQSDNSHMMGRCKKVISL